MRSRRCLAMALLAGVLGLTTTRDAEAQVVRGGVTERGSGRPLGGVLVSAAAAGTAASRDTVYVLTSPEGQYSLRLPRAGSFVLLFKRIGVARHQSAPIRLGAGESTDLNVELDPLAARLPITDVTATNLCLGKPDQLHAIVALWDEARTVLRASEVTRRDQQVSGWLTKYQRTLDPRSLRILDDQRSVAEGRYTQPMRSADGAFLARVGFWGATSHDTLVFHGPDAAALLSEPFQAGYCFTQVQGSGARKGLLGIEFRPKRGTEVGGITGTMWMDLLSFELRFVEFRYQNLITEPRSPDLGGEVHFVRHGASGWIVQRWHIRMPEFRFVERASQVRGRRVVEQFGVLHRIREEGGSLYSTELQSWEAPGSVRGSIVDSTGRRPLGGAVVSLSGTPFSTVADSTGSFRFDSIVPGPYVLLAANEGYAGLGQLVTDLPLNVDAGKSESVRLRAVSTETLRARLCVVQGAEPGATVLRVLAIDADSGHALGALRLWLRWPRPPDETTRDSVATGLMEEGNLLGIQHQTDGNGVATFCGVPSSTPLELVMLRSDDLDLVANGARFVRVTSFVVGHGELVSRTIQVKRPR